MQFQTATDGVITVTLENKVFGNETLDPTIVIAGTGQMARVSIKSVQAIASSDSVHKARYFKGMLAVLKDIIDRPGFDDFNGAYLVDELCVEITTQMILAKCK